MDNDGKELRTSSSIPIKGKKPEPDPSPAEQAQRLEEEERLEEGLFGGADDDENDDDEARGGLFGDDDNGEANPAVSANARRLADLVMQVDPGRAFNPVGGGGSRWKEYITGLESGDEMIQLDSLINLADELCVMTEETANGFKLDTFLPPLVMLLNTSDNPNTVLLACRCMSHILEALPGSENAFVRNDAIPGLVEKLLNIEYDDLRDQAMNVLSRLCQSPLSASAVLKSGGLSAILANLDFSAINTQVVAVTCAANMLRIIPADTWPQIRDALPTLAMLLQYEDQRLVEKATASLASICTQFLSDSSKLESIIASGALPNLVRLVTERVSERSSELSNLTWMVIRCLATLCRGLPNTAEILIATGVPAILKNLLLAERENATKGIRQSAKTNTQAVYDMVALADQLFPPLPADVAIYLKSAPVQHVYSGGRARGLFQAAPASEIDIMSSGSIPIPSDGSPPAEDARAVMYKSQPNTLLQVADCLLGTMTLVFGSRVNPQLRIKCLSTIAKIVFACTPEMLASLLKDLTFSSFLASLLSSKDLKFIAVALSIAETLMLKLPDIFSTYFTREGVVHEIEGIISSSAQFKPVSRTSTPSVTPGGVAMPSTPNEPSFITPLTPTSAPSFMWEALASPPNPSTMKARFGSKDAHSMRNGSPTAQPILFGGSPAPSSPTAVPIAFGFGDASAQPSTPQAPKNQTAVSASPSTPATPVPSSDASSDGSAIANQTESLRIEVLERCKTFKQKHFVLDGATSEGLDELATLTEGLTDCLWNEKDASKLQAMLEKVSALFLNGISTHEFVRSALPAAIFQFLTLKDGQAPTPRHERISMFIHTFGKRAKSESAMDGAPPARVSPLTRLVKELHNAIDKNENFQVKLNPAMTNGGIRANTIVEFLTKAFSIKLLRDPTDTVLPIIYEGPVSVEPLATGKSIKEFILNKVNHAEDARRKAEEKKRQQEAEAAATPVASRTRSKGESPAKDEKATTPKRASSGKKELTASGTPVSLTASSASTSSANATSDSDNAATGTYGDIGEDEDDLEGMDEDSADHDQGVFVQEVADTETAETTQLATPKRSTKQRAYSLDSLLLTIDGVPLNDTLSIFKVLKDKVGDDSPASTDSEVATPLAPMWSQVHDVHYRLASISASPIAPASPKAASPSPSGDKRSKSKKKRGEKNDDSSPSSSAPAAPPASSNSSSTSPISSSSSLSGQNTPESIMQNATDCAALDRVLDRLMRGNVGETCGYEKTLVQLLSLLQVLLTVNQEVPRLLPNLQFSASGDDIATVPVSDFINAKLTAKLSRQLQDPLALCTNTLPAWCNSLCSELSFLFPLDLRQLYFRGSSLGVPRALSALKDRVEGVLDGNFGRIPPHKVRVSRDSIPHLNTAIVILQRIRTDSRSILEVEYANEVATGAGPTLEFYTLVSHAFQQSKFNLWVADGSDKIIKHSPRENKHSPHDKHKHAKSKKHSSSMDVDEEPQDATSISAATQNETSPRSKSHRKGKRGKESKNDSPDASSTPAEFMQIVSNNGGLFPKPLLGDRSSAAYKETVKRFSFLGTFVAKAIMDDRMMDIPFSVAFFKALLGHPLQLDDLEHVYPQLIAIIKDFMTLIAEKKAIEDDTSIDSATKTQRIGDLKYKGGSVEDMWLTFELPGSQTELVSGGAQRDVTIHNLSEWVDLVVDAIAGKGIQAQFEAICEGFNHIFPVEALRVFEPSELETLICGSIEQDWSKDAILDAANYTHGFSVHSKVSQWFATLLSSFTDEQRRKFLRFATGSPRLPPRGFKGFHHRLTLSRKDAEKSHSADDYYPSVSTCFLFIKIPEYSTFEIFKERFLTAVENGQQGFGLS